MCIAIYKPAHKTISKETLQLCFENNNDGCGFAYINTDYYGKRKIKIYKSMSFDAFYHKYEKASRLMPESPFLIHFRIKTHGTKDVFNCHPFQINNETVFIHNGIISGVGIDKKKSDTQLFNDKILKGLSKGFQNISAIKILIEDFIGMSKLCILSLDGSVVIMNESKGSWSEGIWWSNDSYKPRKVYNSTSYVSKRYDANTNKWSDKSAAEINREKRTEVKEIEYKQPTDRVAQLTLSSWSSCDCCSSSFMIAELTAFKVEEAHLAFCRKCEAGELKNNTVNFRDRIIASDYLKLLNEERNKRYNFGLVDEDDIVIDDYGYDSYGMFQGRGMM